MPNLFRFGHSAQECFYSFDQTYQPPSNGNNDPQPAAFVAISETVINLAWYIDSRASHHYTPDGENLANKTDYNDSGKVVIGNGKGLQISSIDA